ncbi:MAG TPA: DNA methyltransferase [Naasia sp.]
MKPYYEDDLVTLFHGDALEEHLDWLDADVLIFDPPYGIDYHSGSAREQLARSILNDRDTQVRDAILGTWYAERNLPALCFGSPKVEKPEMNLMTLVWDKGGALGMGDLRIPWKPGHEEIYVMGNWTHARGQRSTDVLRCAPVQSLARNGRYHPHQKPVALMQELISRAPLGKVADPTCGVGTTLLAAASLGQRAVGVELDEAYCEIAAKRLSNRAVALEVST